MNTDQELWRKIGRRLREEREKRKLTIEHIANSMFLSSGFIGLVERGERGTSLENLITLCAYYDISFDYLISDQQSEENDEMNLLITKLLTCEEKKFISEIGKLLHAQRHSEYELQLLKEHMSFQSKQLKKMKL